MQPLTYGKALATACPICAGVPRYRLDCRTLTCSGCNLAVTLDADEHHDLVWYLAAPGLSDVPLDLFLRAVLAAHHISGAFRTPDARVISARDGQGWKWQILPIDGETPAERAARLADQAELNGVEVWPVNAALTEWRATSQRRKEDGSRAHEPYHILLTPMTARCSCPAPNDTVCAHLMKVHSTLLDLRANEEPPPDDEPAPVAWNSEKVAEIQAKAYSDLWG